MPMPHPVASHCCLCGLMCPLNGVGSACPCRNRWLTEAGKADAVPAYSSRAAALSVARVSQLFRTARQPLVWLDAADVQSVRAAVHLAHRLRGTVHIGQSTGGALPQRVLGRQGWLGTSLAEVATHADLILTLGDDILSEAPLLPSRFFQPAIDRQPQAWWHISQRPPTASREQEPPSPSPSKRLCWPRKEWYQRLTNLLWHLRDAPQPPPLDAGQEALLGRMRQARYAVWLWDSEEFCDAIDELLIRRLQDMAQVLSGNARCSLLSLDANVGRVTAEETLRWLTGLSTTATFDGRQWTAREHWEHYQLDDWPSEFDAILFVRTVPTLRPVPHLQADHWLLPEDGFLAADVDPQTVLRVAATGQSCSGQLMRGDRGAMLLCHAENQGISAESFLFAVSGNLAGQPPRAAAQSVVEKS
ncbi:MAG: hypothetical protein KDA45_03035 [Planctomycetales bacterium]|nr:hypothetical protein [Planctomycetales bacterium]